MLVYPIAALVLLGAAVEAFAGSNNKKLITQGQFHRDLYGSSEQSAALRQRVISKSTLIRNDGEQRKLEDEFTFDGSEYYQQHQQRVDFTPSNYALSYHRCASIQQWDSELAAEENTSTVLGNKSFAILRFCPVDTCDVQHTTEEEKTYTYKFGYDYDDGLGDDEEEQQEEQSSWVTAGARSSGCSSDYGEYMIELEDYLAIMAEYRESQLESYCTYCEGLYYYMYQNENNRRDLKFEADVVQEADRKLNNGYGNEKTCINYGSVCKGALDDAMAITSYFQCTEVQDNYGNSKYIGPYCDEDGFTVTLGLYADYECSQFMGGDVSNYLTLGDDGLKSWYDSKHGPLSPVFQAEEDDLCISCKYVDEDDWGTKLNADSDSGSNYEVDTGMSNLCASVVSSSAHCNKHYQNFQRGNLSKEEWAEMKLSCGYIDSIRNSYDYSLLGSAVHVVTNVSPSQIFFLVFSILVCIILAVWSKSLHASLTKKEPWPQRFGKGWTMKSIFRKKKHPLEIDPTESGIGASRVRSDATVGTSYYMTQ